LQISFRKKTTTHIDILHTHYRLYARCRSLSANEPLVACLFLQKSHSLQVSFRKRTTAHTDILLSQYRLYTRHTRDVGGGSRDPKEKNSTNFKKRQKQNSHGCRTQYRLYTRRTPLMCRHTTHTIMRFQCST